MKMSDTKKTQKLVVLDCSWVGVCILPHFDGNSFEPFPANPYMIILHPHESIVWCFFKSGQTSQFSPVKLKFSEPSWFQGTISVFPAVGQKKDKKLQTPGTLAWLLVLSPSPGWFANRPGTSGNLRDFREKNKRTCEKRSGKIYRRPLNPKKKSNRMARVYPWKRETFRSLDDSFWFFSWNLVKDYNWVRRSVN